VSEIVIELDQLGIQQFLVESEVTKDLEERTAAIVKAAGEGMVSKVALGKVDQHGHRRMRGEVWTDTEPARLAESENRALTRSLDAGR
jgi:hypothetical protein